METCTMQFSLNTTRRQYGNCKLGVSLRRPDTSLAYSHYETFNSKYSVMTCARNLTSVYLSNNQTHNTSQLCL